MSFKKVWRKLPYWGKGGLVGFLLALSVYLILNITYLINSVVKTREIACPTFGGGLPCSMLGYLIISVVWFFWYFIIIGLPLVVIFIILSILVGYFKGRK